MQKSIKIVYKDANDKIQFIIIPIPEEDYIDSYSYTDNVDRCVDEIMDKGGFWLNNTTIIPAHRIRSFHTCEQVTEPLTQIKNKPNLNKNRRHGLRGKRPKIENSLSGNNQVS
jgi:hypothetical protein